MKDQYFKDLVDRINKDMQRGCPVGPWWHAKFPSVRKLCEANVDIDVDTTGI